MVISADEYAEDPDISEYPALDRTRSRLPDQNQCYDRYSPQKDVLRRLRTSLVGILLAYPLFFYVFTSTACFAFGTPAQHSSNGDL